ncbi:hypothetical protein GCM10010211_48510 [Streptomyces albospinus]|uniref:Uncharacterized protein n=1 Tax=Streptomyces albospinus TaxID=285515 RepID=A0ABQ2VDK0_9ACTN|nr:hypothetical protein GCM10010211_48510 [Streptomyces albospinus]
MTVHLPQNVILPAGPSQFDPNALAQSEPSSVSRLVLHPRHCSHASRPFAKPVVVVEKLSNTGA